MHEMSLAEGIVQLLEEHAHTQQFRRVKQIWLQVGELAGVEPEALTFCLDVVLRGSLADLDGEHAEKQEVIAREQSVRRIEAPGADHQRHRDAAEQAGPGLLDAEAKEFVKPRGPAALRHHQAEAMFGGDEAAQRRPVGRGARDRFGLACYPVMHAADGGGRSRSQRGGVVQISLNP